MLGGPIFQYDHTMLNLILFGPPGSGKGTQAAKLVEQFELLHISTGDLFRFHLKNKTELGLQAQTFIDRGDLVPDAVTIGMLVAAVEANPDVKGVIFDGFPRTIPQSEALDTFLKKYDDEVNRLVMLDVPDDEIVGRLLERGKTSGRKDDANEEVIRKRLANYVAQTSPVYDYYAAKGKAVKINGVGDIDTVFARLSAEVGATVS